MKNLKGKNILLLAPDFFGYDIEIRKKLEWFGASVDLYDERPSDSFIVKAIIRLYSPLLFIIINNYFNRIVRRNIHKNYDYILIIKGEVLTPKIVNLFKAKYPNAKMILYLWDSIENYKDIKRSLSLFDRTLTFDLNDSKNTEGLIYRPLFFIDAYTKLKSSDIPWEKRKYDLLFIGTIHSDRWIFLEQIQDQALRCGLKIRYYLYIQSPVLLLVRKLFDKRLRSLPVSMVNLKSISQEKTVELVKDSRVILDISHAKQTGLTMRTLESLGANRKLVTTNTLIKESIFYNPKNISILDRDNPVIALSFFDNEYIEIEREVYNKHSIAGWLSDLFNLEEVIIEL